MGTLFKRGEYYYANLLDKEGRRRKLALHTTDRVVAKAKLRELELSTTDRAPNQTETLDEALTFYLDVALASSPDGTRRSYGQKARHLSRLMGGSQLDLMTRETVQRYIAARLDEGAHTHSIHKELVVLRQALREATDRQRFHLSVESLVPKFDAGYEPRRTYLTPEQFITLTERLLRPLGAKATEAQRARWEARRVRRSLFVLLVALASPRLGELEALEWSHVDFTRNLINIPKGKTVGRPVPLHPLLRLWLEKYRQQSGPIVEPWGKVSRDLPRLCERAGVPRCTPNDLRRTFASWLVQQGESLYVVATLLGHSSTRMVERVYGRLDSATLARAISKLPLSWDAGGTHETSLTGASGHGVAQVPSEAGGSDAPKDTKPQ